MNLSRKMEAGVGRQRKLGEAPKTLEEIHYIGIFNQWLVGERKRLGLPANTVIESERVHLFSNDNSEYGIDAVVKEKLHDAQGYFLIHEDSALIERKDKKHGTLASLPTVSHELIHQKGYREFDRYGAPVRIGWRDRGVGGAVLDEAVTEGMNEDFLISQQDVIKKSLLPEGHVDGDADPLDIKNRSYERERKIVRDLCSVLDQRLSLTTGGTWDIVRRYHEEGDTKVVAAMCSALTFEQWSLLMCLGSKWLFAIDGEQRQFFQKDLYDYFENHWEHDEDGQVARDGVDRIKRVLRTGVLDAQRARYNEMLGTALRTRADKSQP